MNGHCHSRSRVILCAQTPSNMGGNDSFFFFFIQFLARKGSSHMRKISTSSSIYVYYLRASVISSSLQYPTISGCASGYVADKPAAFSG